MVEIDDLEPYTTDSGLPAVGAIVSTVSGTILLSVMTGLTAIPLGIARAIERILGGPAAAITIAVPSLTRTVRTQVGLAWDAIEGGLFGLPINLIAVLLAFGGVALAARFVLGGDK